ncbi:hypothetical protein RIF29_39732 [Crotalaria pallida]|uniref:Complex III subunit 9 n=1 Tax=Crotalaria pallida TaxID=3830 RepID=A0AAN9E1T0_CROPI
MARGGGGVFEGLYKVLMRRNSVYVTFVIIGAFAGERAVDYGVHKIWERNNIGKRYEDISVLGQRPTEDDTHSHSLSLWWKCCAARFKIHNISA